MQHRPFGPTGVPVPVIGQGSWTSERTRAASVAALRRGIALGMTHVDTAEMYGRGAAEEVIAEAVGGRRDEVFIVSKVLAENASRARTIEACHRSLRHLHTDYLDTYLLHSPSRYPFEETLAAFHQLVEEGSIRAFGVSNFDAGELDHAVALAGPGAIACNQVQYHLMDRSIERSLIARCQAHGVALVAYSPYGQGDFPTRHPVLESVAAAQGATPHQVALAFLLRWPGSFVIPKASSLAHAEENATAGDLVLAAGEIAAIAEAFPV
ncbi:MAG: aldo/keto reductase [Actinomycetota bacterium]